MWNGRKGSRKEDDENAKEKKEGSDEFADLF